MKRRTIIIFSIIAILLVVGAAGYFGFSGSAQGQPTPQAPQTVAVTTCDVQQTVEAPGKLRNTSETQILMPVDGNVSQVLVQAGESVSAGQILARLDDTSKANAQIALKDAQTTLDQMELKAPFSGIVTEVDAVTDLPKKTGDTLFKIIDPKALEVKANVTQEDYPLLEPGQSALVYFDARPDVTVEGKVARIVPKVGEGDSPTYDIFLSLDEVPDGLVDGMTVDTAVTIANRQGALCLPRSVVHASGDNKASV